MIGNTHGLPRVLCAPDKLRGALRAVSAARALALGVREAGGTPVELPIADGGEGTLEALGTRAVSHPVVAVDALGRPCRALMASLDDGATVVVEAAQAIGLHRRTPLERDVLQSSSAGLGRLICAALDRAPRAIVVAVGGTATIDGGAGMLAALGARGPTDTAGLLADQAVDLDAIDPRLADVRLDLLVDVMAPLTGPAGAAVRFGPQKGAAPALIERLDAALERWAHALGVDAGAHGSGAGGGVGAALQALGARTLSGADAVLDVAGFDQHLAGCDLCLVAEGRVDASTLQGKAVATVVTRSVGRGVPVVVLGGSVDPHAAEALRRRGAQDVRALGDADRPLDQALAAAAVDLQTAAREIVTAHRAAA